MQTLPFTSCINLKHLGLFTLGLPISYWYSIYGLIKIKFRIGLRPGEVVFPNNNVFGEGVNFALRLESSAGVIKTQLLARSIDNLSTRTFFA
jgi:hypothetical protein